MYSFRKMAWFRKTTVYNYGEIISELRDQVHNAIDAGIRLARSRSPHPELMFRFYASTSWGFARYMYVENIPFRVYLESIERMFGATHHYCISMAGSDPGGWYTLTFVQGRDTVVPAHRPQSLNARMAKAAIALAKESGDVCPITLEPIASLTSVAVAQCGHVCSEGGLQLDRCPMCRVRCAWTLCVGAGV
jgi:hypothetical protein